jgi:hypothetical protein
MFTIVASSTTISWATPMTARISHRRRPGAAVAAGGCRRAGSSPVIEVLSEQLVKS